MFTAEDAKLAVDNYNKTVNEQNGEAARTLIKEIIEPAIINKSSQGSTSVCFFEEKIKSKDSNAVLGIIIDELTKCGYNVQPRRSNAKVSYILISWGE